MPHILSENYNRLFKESLPKISLNESKIKLVIGNKYSVATSLPQNATWFDGCEFLGYKDTNGNAMFVHRINRRDIEILEVNPSKFDTYIK